MEVWLNQWHSVYLLLAVGVGLLGLNFLLKSTLVAMASMICLLGVVLNTNISGWLLIASVILMCAAIASIIRFWTFGTRHRW